MINAKKELVDALDDITKKYSVSVKCAWVSYKRFSEVSSAHAYLPVGFEQYELESFMKDLDFNYDDGYGSQELHGEVYFDDGSWMERAEYDGSEWWEYKRTPEIPSFLTVEQDWISNT
jgi:hypothetical protein